MSWPACGVERYDMQHSKLVDRAKSGYSIRQHESGVFQVYLGRVKTNSTPVYTSTDLSRARKWREERIAELTASLGRLR